MQTENLSSHLKLNKKSVPVNRFEIGDLEKKLVLEALDSGWISSEGPFVKNFEEKMAALCQREHGIAVANGTLALDLALQALSLSPGDEVIMPSFSIISCSEAVVKAQAIPRFVDADPLTWNMDVKQIEALINKKTKAIMVAHIYGLTVDMAPVFELAQKYHLKIIEDAAEAHGQFYQNRPCGSLGDISIFSFYPNKNITTGEGGMIVCNDTELANRCRSLRNLCFIPERRFVHFESGTNARLSNLHAALGLGQLERLSETIEKKKKMGELYQHLLSDLPDVQLPLKETPYCQNHFWVFGLVFGPSWPDLPTIEEELLKRGIGNRPFFFGLHEQPLYQQAFWWKAQKLKVTEKISRRGLYIPSGSGTSKEDQEYVAAQLFEMAKIYV